MEKRAPHCTLPTVKAMVKAGKVRATWSARAGAAAMGMGIDDIVEVILSLSVQDFYKSMTTHADLRSGKTCTAPRPRREKSI